MDLQLCTCQELLDISFISLTYERETRFRQVADVVYQRRPNDYACHIGIEHSGRGVRAARQTGQVMQAFVCGVKANILAEHVLL